MKELKLYITTVFLLLIVTIAATLYGMVTAEQAHDRLDKLEQKPVQVAVKQEPQQDFTGLVEKVEELSRYVERLEMENAAQADYIREMGKTWDGWASKNNFPKGDGEK